MKGEIKKMYMQLCICGLVVFLVAVGSFRSHGFKKKITLKTDSEPGIEAEKKLQGFDISSSY